MFTRNIAPANIKEPRRHHVGQYYCLGAAGQGEFKKKKINKNVQDFFFWRGQETSNSFYTLSEIGFFNVLVVFWWFFIIIIKEHLEIVKGLKIHGTIL